MLQSKKLDELSWMHCSTNVTQLSCEGRFSTAQLAGSRGGGQLRTAAQAWIALGGFPCLLRSSRHQVGNSVVRNAQLAHGSKRTRVACGLQCGGHVIELVQVAKGQGSRRGWSVKEQQSHIKAVCPTCLRDWRVRAWRALTDRSLRTLAVQCR